MNHRRSLEKRGKRRRSLQASTAKTLEKGVGQMLTVIELDGGFDGMLPDPIADIDVVDRLEQQDLQGYQILSLRPRSSGRQGDQAHQEFEQTLDQIPTELASIPAPKYMSKAHYDAAIARIRATIIATHHIKQEYPNAGNLASRMIPCRPTNERQANNPPAETATDPAGR